jgi:hypothetical protein
MTGWEGRFRFYRASPARAEINGWLSRFNAADRDVAARVLDCVEVISEPSIQEGYKEALNSIDGWDKRVSEREGKWVFTGFGKPSESGMSMLRMFREANGLTAQLYDNLFHSIPDLPKLRLSAEDTIILVDDFSGSGKQICDRWPKLEELIASDARCFIVLTAATVVAIRNIEDKTVMKVVAKIIIERNENIFADACHRFNAAEKATLLRYCRKADAKNPKGFNECGLLYVLSHKTPNNSIPVLHVNHDNWVGLFPRNLQRE